MAKLLKLRRGTTTQHSSFTGAEGEVTVDTDKEVLVVHDGSTAGGHPMAAQDMDNVPAGAILGTQLENSGVTAGSYGSSSAIPIVTVDAQGLVTAASTTSIDSTRIDNGTSNVRVANNGSTNVSYAGTDRLSVTNTGATVTGNLDVSAGVDVTGNITATGTVDGRDVAADGTKLDGIESGATADQTGAEIAGALSDQRPSMKGATFTDDGTSDPIVNIKTDDASPWALRIGNDNHSGSNDAGMKIYQGNDGTGELWMLSENATYEDFHFRLHSTAGNKKMIKFSKTNQEVELFSGGDSKFNTNSSGVNVTGNIAVSGTVDGVDVAARDTLFGGLTSSSGILTTGVTAHTYGQSENSNKVATTSYVRTAIANADAFPSGTKMLFQQTSAPTGWTKVTSSVDNKALRIVSGSVSSGGNQAFTSAFASRTPAGSVGASGNSTASFSGSVSSNTGNAGASTSSVSTSGNVNNHTLSNSQMPSHSHSFAMRYQDYYDNYHAPQRTSSGSSSSSNQNTNNSGGSNAHSHGFSGSSHSHNVNNHFHSFSANFSGNTGNHTHNAGSFSGTAMDFAVQYIDVIIATKD